MGGGFCAEVAEARRAAIERGGDAGASAPSSSSTAPPLVARPGLLGTKWRGGEGLLALELALVLLWGVEAEAKVGVGVPAAGGSKPVSLASSLICESIRCISSGFGRRQGEVAPLPPMAPTSSPLSPLGVEGELGEGDDEGEWRARGRWRRLGPVLRLASSGGSSSRLKRTLCPVPP